MLAPIKHGLGYLIENLYYFTDNYVLAIVLLTIIVKTALLPLTVTQLRSQAAMSELQPKIKELQKKYKNDKETLNVKTMELYKEHNANPLMGCLPILIQFPIIIALFAILKEPDVWIFHDMADKGASILSDSFLWVKNLAQPDMLGNVINSSWADKIPGLFPIMAAVLTYLQFVIASPTADMNGSEAGQSMQKNMKLFMPIMILLFARSMSSALVMYWVTSNIYQICQQVIIKRIKDRRKAS